MPKLEVVNVFIASPGDLGDERKMFREIVGRVNDLKARAMGFMLEPVGWEDALPGGGRAQEIINDDVRACHVFVMLLWKKWGTPSGKFSSGTEEEFSIAQERYAKTKEPHLLVYFRSVPIDMMADPGPQLQKVIEFRTKIERDRLCLYKSYDHPEQWEELLTKHLCQWLDKKKYGSNYAADAASPSVEMPPEIEQSLRDLQKRLQDKDAQLKTTQDKLREAAVGYAVDASQLIEEGKFTLAEEKFAKAIGLYEEPEVINNFGRFLLHLGSLDRAKETFEKVLSLSLEGESKVHHAAAYNLMGLIYSNRGSLDEATEMFKKSYDIFGGLTNKKGLADPLANLGRVSMMRGRLGEARETYEEALAIHRRNDNQAGVAVVLVNLGRIYMLEGDTNQAEKMQQQALEIFKATNAKAGVALAQLNLGNVYRRKGQLDEAEKAYKHALDINEALSGKDAVAQSLGNLGILHAARGDVGEAESLLSRSLEMSLSLGHKENMAIAHSYLGDLCMNAMQPDKAREHVRQAIELYKELGNDGEAKRLQSALDEL